MFRVHTPEALRLLLQTGNDITRCHLCGQVCMELLKTFIYHTGSLVDIELRNRDSPKKKKKC
jgi:hypothetical protein